MQSIRQTLKQQYFFSVLQYRAASTKQTLFQQKLAYSIRAQHTYTTMSKAVIITGATGTQGGALIQALVDANADLEIIAVSRDPSSNSAQRLLKKSPKIKVVAGDMEKPEQLFNEAKKVTQVPVWGFFSVQSNLSMNPFDDPETRQGKALVDVALKNNVSMFVYSSVERGGDKSFNNPTNVPHFITKHKIEHHLVEKSRGTNMAYTILRPVAFMNNFREGFATKAFSTVWNIALPTKPLQIIAPSDIGYFGAQAFLKPDEYKNRGISLAGDELTFPQVAQTWKKTTGQDLPMTYRLVGRLMLLMLRDLRLMFKWFGEEGFGVDIAELRKIHPGMKTFERWLEEDTTFAKKQEK